MRKTVMVGVVVIAAVILSSLQVRAYDMAPGRWWLLPQVAKDLDLSSREKKKLEKYYAKSKRELIDQRSALEKEQLTLEDLMDRDPLDEKALTAQFARVEEVRQKLAAERFSYLLNVRKLLGVERFKRLLGMAMEMRRQGADGRRDGRWSSDEP